MQSNDIMVLSHEFYALISKLKEKNPFSGLTPMKQVQCQDDGKVPGPRSWKIILFYSSKQSLVDP